MQLTDGKPLPVGLMPHTLLSVISLSLEGAYFRPSSSAFVVLTLPLSPYLQAVGAFVLPPPRSSYSHSL